MLTLVAAFNLAATLGPFDFELKVVAAAAASGAGCLSPSLLGGPEVFLGGGI